MIQQNDYLSHHGILGQRWGIRRYQNKDGTRTAEGKKHSAKLRGSDLANYTVKKRIKAEAKAKSAAEKQVAKDEALKQSLIKSRDAKKIYKNAHLFSTEELGQITERLYAEKKLKDLTPSFVDKGKKVADTIGVLGDTLGKIGYATEKGIHAYNNTAKIMNGLAGTNMKIIGERKEERRGTTSSKMQYDMSGKLIRSEITKNDGYGNSHTVIRGSDGKKKKKNDEDDN